MGEGSDFMHARWLRVEVKWWVCVCVCKTKQRKNSIPKPHQTSIISQKKKLELKHLISVHQWACTLNLRSHKQFMYKFTPKSIQLIDNKLYKAHLFFYASCAFFWSALDACIQLLWKQFPCTGFDYFYATRFQFNTFYRHRFPSLRCVFLHIKSRHYEYIFTD